MRTLALVSLVSLAPSIVLADDLQSGLFRLQVDGAEGSLRISEGAASISIASPGRCAGSAEGALSPAGRGVFTLTDARYRDICRVEIKADEDGRPISTVETGGCFAYHGASCGFDGTVIGRDVDVSISAIDEGFNARSKADRIEIQRVLSAAGHYAGGLDGVTGRGTRGAIIDAAQAALETSPGLDLSTRAGVDAFIISLIGEVGASEPATTQAPAEAAQVPADEPAAATVASGDAAETDPVGFGGTWSCDSDMFDEQAEFIFADGSVTLKNIGATMTHEAPIEIGGRSSSILLEVADGDRLGLFEITAETMIVMSNGEIFDCRRSDE